MSSINLNCFLAHMRFINYSIIILNNLTVDKRVKRPLSAANHSVLDDELLLFQIWFRNLNYFNYFLMLHPLK